MDASTRDLRGNSSPWALGLLLAVLVWAYWNTLAEAALAWRGDQYSHGPWMPIAAVALLWLRRRGGRSDWRPQGPEEARWFFAMTAVWTLAGFTYLGGQWLAKSIPPSDLARGILSSAIIFLATLLYTLGLIWGVVAAARTWLVFQQIARETEEKPRLDEGLELTAGRDPGTISEGATGSQKWRHALGFGILISAVVLRLVFSYLGLEVPAMGTFILAALGVFLEVLGPRAFRWCWPAMVMLFFAFPLPYSVERAVLVPLQGVAATSGTYLLQTLGLDATNEGAHFIRLGDIQLGVVEQCSGLRMATVFLALVVLYVSIAELPRWQIPLLVLSAVPIALVVNVLRITVTGVLYVYAGAEWAQRVFHDWAGFLMPIMAVLLLMAFRWLLDRLILFEEESAIPLPQRVSKEKRSVT